MAKMTSSSTRHYGKVFDKAAAEYDQNRPEYPDELINEAFRVAGLEAGDCVLELGCGSGQLTRSLIRRGLRVDAVEPGAQLVALAKQRINGRGTVAFQNVRFEDAPFSSGSYKAVFCASAFHWIDPDVSWQKVADALCYGGTFVLVQYFGLKEDRTARDLALQLDVIRKVAPDIAASWPQYYTIDEIYDGVLKRRNNISDVWSWLGDYDIVRRVASELFSDVQVTMVPAVIEKTADEILALMRTASYYDRLSDEQRSELDREYHGIQAALKRPIRASTVTILVTAKRN